MTIDEFYEIDAISINKEIELINEKIDLIRALILVNKNEFNEWETAKKIRELEKLRITNW